MTTTAVSRRPALVPGTISPRRPVPAGIRRPDYVLRGAKARYTGSNVHGPEMVRAVRHASVLAARALQAVGRAVAPGVTTDDLDRVGHEFLVDHGAYPSTLGYPGSVMAFPKSLCTSVNEVVCHGIPDSTVLADGDVVNVDITAYLVTDGVAAHGDTNATFLVGDVDEEVRLLVERTHEAMMRGIKAVAPGRRVNVIGRAIEKYAARFGYGDVHDFCGHGVGPAFHTGLVIPHYDSPDHDTVIETGMIFTVEPMLTLGDYHHDMWDDGWTAVTKDRSWTAQWEHTILVTDTSAEILTLADLDPA
ncbi:MAG: type I methionyl aminopeptidase [Kineosporiaceae bacterium]